MTRWFFAAAPATRLAALRIAIGTYALVWVIARAPDLLAVSRLPVTHFQPAGAVRILHAPLPIGLVLAIALIAIALLVAFVLGVAYRYTGPLAAAALLWTLCYRNSWGFPFHTENLLVLHVLVLGLAPAADAWALGRARSPATAGHGWPIKLMVLLVIATYAMAGIAKLRIGGLHWLDGELLRNQIAVDNARKALLGSPTALFATPLLDHPGSFTIVAVLTLVVELGAPLVLLGGRIRASWAFASWGFHVGVVLVMNIWFPYPLFGFAYLPLFEVERVWPWLRRNRKPAQSG